MHDIAQPTGNSYRGSMKKKHSRAFTQRS